MKRTFLTIFVAAILAVSQASAADLGSDYGVRDTKRVASPFAGLYVGAFAGVGAASFDGTTDTGEIFDDNDTEDAEFLSGELQSGGVYGAYIGYNAVANKFVFGLELDVGSADITETVNDAEVNDELKMELDWFASLRARVGVLATPNTLLYGTGGIGYIQSKITAIDSVGQKKEEVGTKDLDGITYVIGAGVEHVFHNGATFRLEGLYFGETNANTLQEKELNDDIDAGDNTTIDGFVQIRAGLGYKF